MQKYNIVLRRTNNYVDILKYILHTINFFRDIHTTNTSISYIVINNVNVHYTICNNDNIVIINNIINNIDDNINSIVIDVISKKTNKFIFFEYSTSNVIESWTIIFNSSSDITNQSNGITDQSNDITNPLNSNPNNDIFKHLENISNICINNPIDCINPLYLKINYS